MFQYKRDSEPSERVRGPYNANKESKYVELVLVFDNREYKDMGESKSKVLNTAKTLANIINGVSLFVFYLLVFTEIKEIMVLKIIAHNLIVGILH